MHEIDPTAVRRPCWKVIVKSRPVAEYLSSIGAGAVRHEHRIAFAISVIDDALAVWGPSQVGNLLTEEITRRASGKRQHAQTDIHVTTAEPNLRSVAGKTDAS